MMKQKITAADYEICKPKHLKKISPGQYTKEDWAAIINSTWGSGLPTAQKLAIFDQTCNYLDQGYGAFMNMNYINMDSLRNLYRPEIEAGVSRGRFAAILNHLVYALEDAHTLIEDIPVNAFTEIQPGIPIFITGACVDISHFGAGLTPLPDSTLLVYKALPNHTLGIQPGDIVLGYDGVPWKQLIKQLMEAQLPLRNTQMGSNDESAIHILLQSAGLNWHLFDTIDILKYNTGETVHLPTSLLLNQSGDIWGNEQLPIPGIDFPDVYNEDFVSWGIIEGTTIGYICVWSWFPDMDVSEQFFDAVYNQMYNYETTGLIVDFRVNYGGDMRIANEGYSLLFNETLQKVGFDNRGDPNNHFDMIPSTTHPAHLWIINGDPESFYDKPIAVLTGPNAFSNGDWESVRMQFHHMVRSFGKSTNGAFTLNERKDLGNSDFMFWMSNGSGYLIEGHEYMAHKSANIDEEVWLTQEDVAKGEDTVVKAAMKWIQNFTFVHNIRLDRTFIEPETGSLGINAVVENPNNHNLLVAGLILNQAGEVADSTMLYDDGHHNDGNANDGLWGAFWNPGPDEQHYSFKTKLTDNNVGTIRYDYNINKVTTIGPVVVDRYINISPDTLINPGDILLIRIVLKNEGVTTPATDISIVGNYLDTVVTNMTLSDNRISDIVPGETVTSDGVFIIRFANNFLGDRDIPFEVAIFSGNYLFWKDTFSVYIHPTSVTEGNKLEIPENYSLYQNYPNPFNPTTTIRYSINKSNLVTLKIFNLAGQEVETLVNAYQTLGEHYIKWNAEELPGGIYFNRLQFGNHSETKKLILQK